MPSCFVKQANKQTSNQANKQTSNQAGGTHTVVSMHVPIPNTIPIALLLQKIILVKPNDGFTLHDTLPSLLSRPRICQCKFSGVRVRSRVFLSCRFFSIQNCPSHEQLSFDSANSLFSAYSPAQTISFVVNFHSINLVQKFISCSQKIFKFY